MLVVGEELNFGYPARVLLKMRDELARSDLPNAHLTLHAARADELAALGKADRGDTTFVSIVDLPELLAVVYSVCTDASVAPAADDDFVGEYRAKRVYATLSRRSLLLLCDTACSDSVRVGIPESHRTIFAASDEFVANTGHEPSREYRLSVVLAQEHLREVLVPKAVEVTFISGDQRLQTIRAGREAVNSTIELSFVTSSSRVSVETHAENLTVTTAAYEVSRRDSLDRLDSKRAKIQTEHKLLGLHMEASNIARGSTSDEIVLLILREGHADEATNVSASVDDLGEELSSLRNQLPKSHFLSARDGELIILRQAEFDVLDHATPGDARWSLCEDGRDQGHLRNNMTVGHVPDEHLAIEGVAR